MPATIAGSSLCRQLTGCPSNRQQLRRPSLGGAGSAHGARRLPRMDFCLRARARSKAQHSRAASVVRPPPQMGSSAPFESNRVAAGDGHEAKPKALPQDEEELDIVDPISEAICSAQGR